MVVNDWDFRIWNAYQVPGWPTQIVIDPEGHHLMGFVGENHYGRIDQLVKATIDLHRQRGTLREGALFLEAVPRDTEMSPLLNPGKVLADPDASRLFIADTNHNRLVVPDRQGMLLEVTGSGVATASGRAKTGAAMDSSAAGS